MDSGRAVWPKVDRIASSPMAQHGPVASLVDQRPIVRVVSSLSSAVTRHSWIRQFVESLGKPDLTKIGFGNVYGSLVGLPVRLHQPDSRED
jgi:hypothetical protein